MSNFLFLNIKKISFASHKVFGGHFLCVYEIFEKSDSNEIGIKDNLRNISYSMQGNIGLFFYNCCRLA